MKPRRQAEVLVIATGDGTRNGDVVEAFVEGWLAMAIAKQMFADESGGTTIGPRERKFRLSRPDNGGTFVARDIHLL